MERILSLIILLVVLYAILTAVGLPAGYAQTAVLIGFILIVLFPRLLSQLLGAAAAGLAIFTLVMYLTGKLAYVSLGISLLVALGVATVLLNALLPRRWMR